jgi:hypothetical protein
MGTGLHRVSTHEVAWVIALLDDLPNVDVLEVKATPDTLRVGDTRVRALDVSIHAATWEDAVQLATTMSLREIDGHYTEGVYGRSVWRNWAGWAPLASFEQPVQVTVTAAELEHELPTLFDALDAFDPRDRSPEGASS